MNISRSTLRLAMLALALAMIAIHAPAQDVAVQNTPQDRQDRPKSVVLVCHVMDLKSLKAVRDEMAKAIGGLGKEMSFDIVLLDVTGKPTRAFAAGLSPATDDAKKKATAFLTAMRVTRSDDPTPALRIALAAKPELLYLLTDATALPKTFTADSVRKLNTQNVRITPILFERYTKEVEQVLQAIAENHRGTYRYVKISDVGE